jgi:hypothetical protein
MADDGDKMWDGDQPTEANIDARAADAKRRMEERIAKKHDVPQGEFPLVEAETSEPPVEGVEQSVDANLEPPVDPPQLIKTQLPTPEIPIGRPAPPQPPPNPVVATPAKPIPDADMRAPQMPVPTVEDTGDVGDFADRSTPNAKVPTIPAGIAGMRKFQPDAAGIGLPDRKATPTGNVGDTVEDTGDAPQPQSKKRQALQGVNTGQGPQDSGLHFDSLTGQSSQETPRAAFGGGQQQDGGHLQELQKQTQLLQQILSKIGNPGTFQ